MEVDVAYTLFADGPEGEELERCNEESPFVFQVGAEEALPAFEQALHGLKVGEPFAHPMLPVLKAAGRVVQLTRG